MTDINKIMFSGGANDFCACFDFPCEEPPPCSPLVYPIDEEPTRASFCPTEVPNNEYRVFGDPAYLEQSLSEDSLTSFSADEDTRLQLFLSKSLQEQPHSCDDVLPKAEEVDLKRDVDEGAHVKEEPRNEGGDDDVDKEEEDDEDIVDNDEPMLSIEKGFTQSDYALMWQNINAKKSVEMQQQHYQILQQQRLQQQQEQIVRLRRQVVDVVEVTPIVSAERDCCDDVPAMELCPDADGKAETHCESMRRPRESISCNSSCCSGLFEELRIHQQKQRFAVEVAQRNISTEMFTGKIDPTRRVINLGEAPARATLSSLLRPAVVQSCSHLWEIAAGYVVPATSTMNRILLGRVMEGEDGLGMQVDISVSGWLVPDRISDLKWMSTTDLVVSYGRTVAVVNTATRASLASKRPSGAFTPYMSLTFDDESKNKSITETEVIPGESSVLVASYSSCFSRVNMGGKSPVVDSCHCFHRDGVTSARTVLGSCELASCTLESGPVHCFDARERWEPVLSMSPRGLERDTLFLSHDWVDENTCVCAYHNATESSLAYMDKRFAGELKKVPIPVFPYDIRVRDGDCLISGEPCFALVHSDDYSTTLIHSKSEPEDAKSGSEEEGKRKMEKIFHPKPGPDESIFQPNVMCAHLDDARFLTASNHLNLTVWSRLL